MSGICGFLYVALGKTWKHDGFILNTYHLQLNQRKSDRNFQFQSFAWMIHPPLYHFNLIISSPYHVFHHTFRWSPGSQVPSGSRPSNFSNFSSRSKPTWWPSTPASVASNGSPNGLPPWECCSRFPKMRPGCGDLGDGLDEPHKMGTKKKSSFGEKLGDGWVKMVMFNRWTAVFDFFCRRSGPSLLWFDWLILVSLYGILHTQETTDPSHI